MGDFRTTFYKRKDGRHEGLVRWVDPETGEDAKKSFYGGGKKGEQEVKRKAFEFIEKMESGDISDVSKLTVEAWLGKYLKIYCAGSEQTTIEGYKNYIDNHIIPAFGKMKLRDVRPLHIQKFYNEEAAGTSPGAKQKYKGKTVLQEHRILHRAFKKAVSDGLISRNPIDGVDPPQADDFTATIYTEKQYEALMKKLKGDQIETLVILAGMLGMRRAELLGLTWDDFDFEKGIVQITKNRVPTKELGSITKGPKNKTSVRVMTIPSNVMPSLKRLRGIGKIITKSDGEEYHPGTISNKFSSFLERNDLPHIRLHDLRHFNATMMLKYGVADRIVQERLGHASGATTRKYQQVMKDMDKTSANKLNVLFKTAK